jgi:hypothetical protein
VAALSTGALIGGTTGSGENVAYEPKTITVQEGDGKAVVTVARDACENPAFDLRWGTQTNGSATEGLDYTRSSGVERWARCDGEGRDTKTFTIPILDDDEEEGTETIRLYLGAMRTTTSSTTPLPDVDSEGAVVIEDDDRLRLDARDVRVREDAGVARVTVTRRGGPAEHPIDVRYRTEEGTAKAGSDFDEVSGEVTLAEAGDSATIEVPVHDDGRAEGPERFKVRFDHADAQGQATVTIDDPPVRRGSSERLPEPVITIPAPVASQRSSAAPEPRACISRRRFSLRLLGLRRATVTVDGKRVGTRRTSRGLTTVVNLRGRLKGRYAVKISGVTKGGRRVTQTRWFRTCAPRRAS